MRGTPAAKAEQATPLGGAQALVSGQSAQVYDEAAQFGSDFSLVVTLVCVAIYLILALLVRSVTAFSSRGSIPMLTTEECFAFTDKPRQDPCGRAPPSALLIARSQEKGLLRSSQTTAQNGALCTPATSFWGHSIPGIMFDKFDAAGASALWLLSACGASPGVW